MTDPQTFATKLDELAVKLMEDAAKDSTPMPQKLEIFKLCSQHHVNLTKIHAKKQPSGDDGGATMASLREQVNGAGTEAPADPGGDDDETDDRQDA